MKETPSLSEFAKQRKRRSSGSWFVTTLSEEHRNQCIEGWKAGMGYAVMLEWLQSIGYEDATGGKLAWLASNYPRPRK